MNVLFQYRWKANAWITSAENLHHAAELLFQRHAAASGDDGEPVVPEDMPLDNPATLLFGYAMENALKGFLIMKLNLDPVSAPKIPGWKHHHLDRLFQKTEIAENSEQLRLLKILSAHIVWAGKYPASFEFEGSHGFTLPKQSGLYPMPFDRTMRETLKPLFEALVDSVSEFRLRARQWQAKDRNN